MDAFTRRIALWRLLAAATEPIGLRALGARLGVSKHTVQRDLDALSRAGVPIEEEREGQTLRFGLPGGRGKASHP